MLPLQTWPTTHDIPLPLPHHSSTLDPWYIISRLFNRFNMNTLRGKTYLYIYIKNTTHFSLLRTWTPSLPNH